jgi:hypothetical protein
MSALVCAGALPEDWAHFDLIMGLTTELLPVVSNTSAQISPGSSIKKLGKTPSLYNRGGFAVGIQDWPAKQATTAEIAIWSTKTDYGICLQTRFVRALDIDVPDRAIAQRIATRAEQLIGFKLPRRFRADSGKCLLAFVLPGEFSKRDFRCDGGLVEFLANGQQFIAAGTHQSGQRYQWEGGLPAEFPSLSVEQFESLWATLVAEFSLDGSCSHSSSGVRKREADVLMPDPVVDFLRDKNLVLGEHKGALHIACPWDHEHSGGTPGDGSTSYFAAGTRGYSSGHFKCLHAHCSGRTDGDFLLALGYDPDLSDEFELVVPAASTATSQPLPGLSRDKQGRPFANVVNVLAILRRPDVTGMQIGFDQFRDEIMWTPPGAIAWRAFTDTDYTLLRERMEGRGLSFKPIGRELIRDAVAMVAVENQFDSAQLWLQSLHWDGVPRVASFLSRYFGVELSAYHEAVSMYLWTALAGRVLEPGCKADMVPVLIGRQGLRKSSAVAAMAPSLECFTEISLSERDSDLSRKMRGVLVAEIGELRGLSSRDLESIKSFITSTHEQWTPKYKEFKTVFPRRLVFVATTNQEEFLADITGNRRWLPVRVSRADVDAIGLDRDQLWAEGAVLFSLLGVCWSEAERMATDVHADHMIADPWMDRIVEWLELEDLDDGKPMMRDCLHTHEVLHSALGHDLKNCSKRDEMRVASCLSALGYEKTLRRVAGKPKRVWVRQPATTL